jgi:hypothetical protein
MFYYGWPTIEKLLLIIPLPDPKDITTKIKGMMKNTTTKNNT